MPNPWHHFKNTIASRTSVRVAGQAFFLVSRSSNNNEMKTSKMAAILFVAVVSAVVAVTPITAQTKPSVTDESSLVGDWRGESICVVRESACHDEDSLYHVAKIAGKPGWFALKADKIVDGKPVTMGTSECNQDAGKQTLTCEFPRGVLHFSIQSDKMTGTMHLTDGTLWRKLTLKKTNP